MNSDNKEALLREILENLRTTDRLDDHPWAANQFVRHYMQRNPGLDGASPGYCLARAVADVFCHHMPGTPPKRGKRLDTQWGAYGILAAQYFVPFIYGVPFPGTFRDAWSKIDQAILWLRFGRDQFEALSEEQVIAYRLVGDELDVTPISTISDWHRKGVNDLANAVMERELFLNHSLADDLVSPEDGQEDGVQAGDGAEILAPTARKPKRSRRSRWAWRIGALIVLGLIVFAGIKSWQLFQLAVQLRNDLSAVENLAKQPVGDLDIAATGVLLDKLHQDIGLMHSEAYPYLRVFGPLLFWVPEYGADLEDSAEILDLAYQISLVLQIVYDAGEPILEAYQSDSSAFSLTQLTHMLIDTQPQFEQARKGLDAAMVRLDTLEIDRYSARTQNLLSRLDRPMQYLDTGLSVAVSLPSLLGAGSGGPKTYLILIQNEDELRATGGFITSVGTVVVQNGELLGLVFEDTEKLVDWSLPYPSAPWQLRDYMNSQVLIFRDANWFPDYPTSVRWVEFLYAYNNQHSVDGVIAIDQHMVVAVLEAIGPLTIPDVPEPITAENVISYMRAAKTPPIQPQPANWTRKAFITQMGNAILDKVLAEDSDIDWRKMVEMTLRTLNERHLLLQFDDPELTAILADFGWDGSVSAGEGDYFMVVDSNIGFNKANAAVETRYSYEVDLREISAQQSLLLIQQANVSPATRSCIQFGGSLPEESRYPIYYCYYNYQRVYVPAGHALLGATPHKIPADWMILKRSVPARVDALEDEIAGVKGYGTLVVVPGGQTLDTAFEFALPPQIIQRDPESGDLTYTLKIQKQPGSLAIPVTIRVQLPPASRLISTNMTASNDANNLVFETDLRTDIRLEVKYTPPKNP